MIRDQLLVAIAPQDVLVVPILCCILLLRIVWLPEIGVCGLLRPHETTVLVNTHIADSTVETVEVPCRHRHSVRPWRHAWRDTWVLCGRWRHQMPLLTYKDKVKRISCCRITVSKNLSLKFISYVEMRHSSRLVRMQGPEVQVSMDYVVSKLRACEALLLIFGRWRSTPVQVPCAAGAVRACWCRRLTSRSCSAAPHAGNP